MDDGLPARRRHITDCRDVFLAFRQLQTRQAVNPGAQFEHDVGLNDSEALPAFSMSRPEPAGHSVSIDRNKKSERRVWTVRDRGYCVQSACDKQPDATVP